MVEFDLQLSRDLVPVIYHDFHACIALKRKKEQDHSDLLEIPIKDLTLEQLQALKVKMLLRCLANVTFVFRILKQPYPLFSLRFIYSNTVNGDAFVTDSLRSRDIAE